MPSKQSTPAKPKPTRRARPRMKPSTPRLSELARHIVIPDGIVTTGWPAVKAKALELGIGYDPWQDQAGRVMLGKRADGKYAATVGGIVWSIPRQVGKTYTIGSLLSSCASCSRAQGGLDGAPARAPRRTRSGRCRRSRSARSFAPHIAVSHIRRHRERRAGDRLTNGSVIMFGAREQGFGRGFTNLDVEVFDEAQILGEKALEDMIAATNQARHPHGALLFYIGTPPRPVDTSEAFANKRRKALAARGDIAGRRHVLSRALGRPGLGPRRPFAVADDEPVVSAAHSARVDASAA
jgi:hypothetical protein